MYIRGGAATIGRSVSDIRRQTLGVCSGALQNMDTFYMQTSPTMYSSENKHCAK